MPKILVLFHSRTGNTAALADAVAEGARSVRFAETDLRRIEDLAADNVVDAVPAWKEARDRLRQRYRTLDAVEQVAEYDGIILGSPSRFGVMSAELSLLLDRLGPLWARGAFVDKVGSAFTTATGRHGGQEATLLGMTAALASFGMILCPSGFTDPTASKRGSPYGATALTGEGFGITDSDLAVARAQGRRVATVAEWVRHAKGHEAAHAHGHGHHHH